MFISKDLLYEELILGISIGYNIQIIDINIDIDII